MNFFKLVNIFIIFMNFFFETCEHFFWKFMNFLQIREHFLKSVNFFSNSSSFFQFSRTFFQIREQFPKFMNFFKFMNYFKIMIIFFQISELFFNRRGTSWCYSDWNHYSTFQTTHCLDSATMIRKWADPVGMLCAPREKLALHAPIRSSPLYTPPAPLLEDCRRCEAFFRKDAELSAGHEPNGARMIA